MSNTSFNRTTENARSDNNRNSSSLSSGNSSTNSSSKYLRHMHRHRERNLPRQELGTSPERQHERVTYPINPGMASLSSRIKTFCNRWSPNTTHASPTQMAEAGFFYLGESDKTKCFCCNGGIQNWEYNDDPWEEHAKWFPQCKFLSCQKGLKFVQQHSKQHMSHIRNSLPATTGNHRTSTNHQQADSHRKSHNKLPHNNGTCIAVPVRQRTESDALPNLHCTTSDAEAVPHPVYLYMSDTPMERDRLVSFTKYPGPFLTSMMHAARDGFYITGNGDTAVCFSCKKNWNISHEAYTTALHASNCQMMSTPGNVPLVELGEVQRLLRPGQQACSRLSSSPRERSEPGPSSPKRRRTIEPPGS